MLIQLDESLGFELTGLTSQEWDALNNLAVAARDGHHYLIAPRNLAQLLSRHGKLGPREQALYKTLSTRYSTIAGIIKEVQTSVRVSRDLVVQRVPTNQPQEIRLPLTFFSTISSVQPAILLCENLDDCRLIYEMARMLAHGERRGTIRTMLEYRPGGGSTTASVAEDILRAGRRLLVTVVDSDRETPAATLGETAKAARRVFDQHERPAMAELIILQARDLENLLPNDFYRDKFGSHPDHGDSIAFVVALDSQGSGAARLHIDIKKGLKLKDLFARSDHPQDFDTTWQPVIEKISQHRLPVSARCVECANAGRCADPANCGCDLTAANGSALLSMGTAACQRHGREYWHLLPDYLRAAIVEVARAVFDWGCANSLQSS